MDHAAGVGVGDGLADLLEDREEAPTLGLGPAPLLEQHGQCLALHELHREVRAPVGAQPELVDRHDARMLELPTDLRLLDEALEHLGRLLMALEQELHGQVAAEVRVPGVQNDTHAPVGDLAEQLVAALGGGARAAMGVRAHEWCLGTVGLPQEDLA